MGKSACMSCETTQCSALRPGRIHRKRVAYCSLDLLLWIVGGVASVMVGGVYAGMVALSCVVTGGAIYVSVKFGFLRHQACCRCTGNTVRVSPEEGNNLCSRCKQLHQQELLDMERKEREAAERKERARIEEGKAQGLRVALGKLPDGLDLNAKTGEISGTARTVQSFAATIEAANQGGACSWVWAGEVRKETPPADLTYSELPPLFVGVE
eukprot:3392516-Rhodomonas_salina.1